MDLEKEVNRLFSATAKTELDILPSIAAAEEFLKESYEGRYFFELIQNARDANKALNRQGTILIQLDGARLSVSNTGAPFSAAGVASICRIGQSDKASQDFIGHKGIGFKSVQEVTERPTIITEFGTLFFDRMETLARLRELHPDGPIEPDQIPLFFFPHFARTKLKNHAPEGGNRFVTRIELPLRNGVSDADLYDDFADIGERQLVLLGNIDSITFVSRMGVIRYDISSKPTSHLIEVSRNGETTSFKEFGPRRPIRIPDSVYTRLEKRERQLFEKDRGIEIKMLLEWDRKERSPVLLDGTKLYLFYPLEITSGFRFVIHSYFSVNPERKALRKTELNSFILQQIAEYITGRFVEELKRSNRSSLLEILAFKRVPDSGLDKFYDDIVSRLKDTRFIYDSVTKRFYTPAEVMVADEFDRDLFPEGEFAGKRLVFVESEDIRDWLTEELGIPYLSYEFIREHIEQEGTRQKKTRNIRFFQSLYAYVADHQRLDLRGKKILLTEHWRLVDNSVDVFYGGVRREISLPKSLRKRITFIHRDIEISDFRDGTSRIGIIEFSTYGLITKLLKLFDDPEVDHADVVRTLKALDLDGVDKKSIPDVKSKIRVPVKGKPEWLTPLYNPIYFDSEHIQELFPKAHLLELERLVGNDRDDAGWRRFLKKVNIWDRPALYLNTYQLDQRNPRNNDLEQYARKYSKPFTVINDRCLDIPVRFNRVFFQELTNHWDDYIAYIEDPDLPDFSCQSFYSGSSETISGPSKVALTHFVGVLKTEAWIWTGDSDDPVDSRTAVAIDLYDFGKAHLQVLRRYLSIVPLDYSAKQGLIDVLDMNHLDRPSITSFIRVFDLLHRAYSDPPQTRDFIDCFNRILAFLSEFYLHPTTVKHDVINGLRGTIFLALDEIDGRSRWALIDNILYVDDRPFYAQLPEKIKARLQPVFTNRDRNTFGRIASQIGRVLSRSVKKEIVASAATAFTPLSGVIPDLPRLLAFLESHIERPLSDAEIDNVRRTQVTERLDLKTRLIMEGQEDAALLLDEDFAIALVDDHYLLDVKSSAWQDVKIKALALTGLFGQILDKDLRTFYLSLGTMLRSSASERQSILLDNGVSLDRINEIEALLQQHVLSSVAQFWMAVLHCMNVTPSEEHFTGDTANLHALARSIMISEEELQAVHSRIDYNDLSSHKNITPFESLFERLGLGLEDFNSASYVRISFKNYHDQELLKLRNRFERRFESCLYRHLVGCSEGERSQFLSLIDSYQSLRPEVDQNAIRLDYERCFGAALKAEFGRFPISLTALKRQTRRVDITGVFYKNRERLISALRKAGLPTDYVQEYLKDNGIRSRLFFAFSKKHVSDYRTQFGGQIVPGPSGRHERDSEINLDEYRDLQDKAIEAYQSRTVDIPQSTGRPSRGGGWGWTPSDKRQDELVGKVGEWSVLQRLMKRYPSVKWVSRYAYEAGYNPEGRDGLGYDIEYVDDNDNKVYVEVKARESGEKSFKITPNEISKAHEAKDSYHIIFVAYALDNNRRSYRDLGNIFMYEDNEDFTSNSRFRAVNEEYRIVFD